jgi:hypothetical protein
MHSASPSDLPCAVCGCLEIERDEVVDSGAHWRLSECLRCSHREVRRITVPLRAVLEPPAVSAA